MRAPAWLLLALLGLLLALQSPAARLPQRSGLNLCSNGQSVLLSWDFPAPCRLYRSFCAFEPGDIARNRLPISQLVPQPLAQSYFDQELAPATSYYYLALSQGQCWKAGPVTTQAAALPSSRYPWLLVDKAHYCLEVRSNEQVLKRYPVVLGSQPLQRKLTQDRASTPEGRYQIKGLQPKAYWHKAFDLNYPNEADRARQQILAPQSPIGGEIQIHGGNIEDNWTWGCIALRDRDMDELFSHPEITQGTVVWITGGQVKYQDLVSDEDSDFDPLELGRWQQQLGLPVTCLKDQATCRALSRP